MFVRKYLAPLLFLIPALCLFGQAGKTEDGSTLNVGKTASLGLETTTTFAWDIQNKSTGLDTKAGLELNFPLFPAADRGLHADNYDTPAVRITLQNASFTWLNTYQTTGGNYDEDSFNSWTARPLVLTFDTFAADVVWTNYFFRLASTTTVFRTYQVNLFSIFDDVIDAGDRWYIRRAATRALWTDQRYNIQNFPLLKGRLVRNYIDDDYRSDISGMLALGAEFNWLSVALKAASYKNGQDNNDNAWLVGADIDLVPVQNLKFGLTSFAGINYDKTTDPALGGRNPADFQLSAEYRLPFSDRYVLTPKAGFDFFNDTVTGKSAWELSAGALFYTRGADYLTSSRLLDWDNLIPVGASASVGINDQNNVCAMLSWFDPAGPDAMLPNFGGFLQLELADLLGKKSGPDFAVLAQLEYLLAQTFTPYIRGGYAPEFRSGSTTLVTGNYLTKAALGCYLTPVHFFSIDLRYELDSVLLAQGGTKTGQSLFSAAFTIRM